ncbi:hypothetical protein THAOC_14238, partial [Thalassiosira oceanica]
LTTECSSVGIGTGCAHIGQNSVSGLSCPWPYSLSSFNWAARSLQAFLWILRWAFWQSMPQYLTRRQAVQFLSFTPSPPSRPQLAHTSAATAGMQLVAIVADDQSTPAVRTLSVGPVSQSDSSDLRAGSDGQSTLLESASLNVSGAETRDPTPPLLDFLCVFFLLFFSCGRLATQALPYRTDAQATQASSTRESRRTPTPVSTPILESTGRDERFARGPRCRGGCDGTQLALWKKQGPTPPIGVRWRWCPRTH